MTRRFDVHVDLMLDGQWTDITGDVYTRDAISITRGRADEAGRAEPGRCGMTFNNRLGKYSPRNPTSDLYGRIGRNTRLRVGVGTPPAAMADFVDDNATSHVALSTDARAAGLLVSAWISSFTPGTYTVPGTMTARAETDSLNSTMATATQTLAAAGATGTRTATFSAAVSAHAHANIAIPGESGTPVVEEVIADEHPDFESIVLRTGNDVEAGWWLLGIQGWDWDPNDMMPGEPTGTPGEWTLVADSIVAVDDGPHLKAWVRRVTQPGIQEVIFGPDPRLLGAVTPNSHAHLYVLSGVAWDTTRLVGEVSAWPPRWDVSGNDVYVQIEAAGIMRRLGQGTKALNSVIYRETLARNKKRPVAYWPCEDGEGGKLIASAVEGGFPMAVSGVEEADLASFDGFACSLPIPVLNTAGFYGDIAPYTPGLDTRMRFLIHVDEAGATNDQTIATLHTSTGLAFRLIYQTGGSFTVRVYGPSNASDTGDLTLLHTTSAVAAALNGKLARFGLDVRQSGANVVFSAKILEVGGSSAPTTGDVTVNSRTVGFAQRVVVAAGRNLGAVAIGHLSVHDDNTSIFDLGDALTGWDEEAAGRRLSRLCYDERIPHSIVGDPNLTLPMGPQRADTLINLLGECADADGGILHESRGQLGLTYRTRATIYNQGHA